MIDAPGSLGGQRSGLLGRYVSVNRFGGAKAIIRRSPTKNVILITVDNLSISYDMNGMINKGIGKELDIPSVGA